MRLLTIGNMYPPHHLGGYELTWRAAVEDLRAAGHRVRVLTTDYRNPAPGAGVPEDPEVAREREDPDVARELHWYWRDHGFPRLSLRERVRLERHNAAVLERHLRELRPDVVSWWAMGGMSLSLIERVRRRGLPAVAVVGDDWLVYGPEVDAWTRLVRRLGVLGPFAGRLTGLPARLDLSGVTWLFNSEATRARARESSSGLGSSSPGLDSTAVAHPGVDTDLFRPVPEHAWGWRLLYVGRIDERKGVDTAIETLARLPEEASLAVLGAGDERHLADLRALCARLRLEQRVEFGLRPRERLPTAYATADALLFPTRWEEPWGLVPLEAMAVGTPVVATGTGGSGEYLRDGENALLVGRAAGPAELAEAVRRLAADPALRRRLREGGRRTSATYTERSYNQAIAAALERTAAG